jgi:uridine phosphorylase
VLLPGDPGRALAVAQAVLEEPKMFNHHRGLWGYTGVAADGEPLTIQSTGMGGPSAAIVFEELCELGVERAVRIGTCGALDAGLSLGDLVVAGEALCFDGTSRALGATALAAGDAELTARLAGAGGPTRVVSTDLFYDPRDGIEDAWREEGCVAVEMETATLFRLGERRGVAVACVLGVSDILDGRRRRIPADDLVALGEKVGRAGAAALLQHR